MRTRSDANAISLARSHSLRIDPRPGLCVRCLRGHVRVIQQGVPGEHLLPAGTAYRAAPEGAIEVESLTGHSLVAQGRASAFALGVGRVYIDSEAVLDDGARRRRFSFLTAFLRRHG